MKKVTVTKDSITVDYYYGNTDDLVSKFEEMVMVTTPGADNLILDLDAKGMPEGAVARLGRDGRIYVGQSTLDKILNLATQARKEAGTEEDGAKLEEARLAKKLKAEENKKESEAFDKMTDRLDAMNRGTY